MGDIACLHPNSIFSFRDASILNLSGSVAERKGMGSNCKKMFLKGHFLLNMLERLVSCNPFFLNVKTTFIKETTVSCKLIRWVSSILNCKARH